MYKPEKPAYLVNKPAKLFLSSMYNPELLINLINLIVAHIALICTVKDIKGLNTVFN